MGFINAVKGIIAKFRAEGKSENEISGIIETAAEKATVNRGHLKKDEFPKPERKVTTSMEDIPRLFRELGITVEQAREAMCKMGCTEERRNTNNWRRMHGLPMRRKLKVRKKNERRERADCH